jgi:hypothetical protein
MLAENQNNKDTRDGWESLYVQVVRRGKIIITGAKDEREMK